MKYAIISLLVAALFLALAVPSRADGFELDKERVKLWEWLADKHADLGDDYAKALVYDDARKQYNRARQLETDHRDAMKGLGYRKKGDEWAEDELLPEENGVSGREYLAVIEELNEERADTYEDCARRCRKLLEDAQESGDARAARIVAIDLLYYEPDNAEARKLRGYVQSDDVWRPEFVDVWRKAGRKLLEESSFGEEKEVEDEQGKAIGVEFNRRESHWLIARTTISTDRTKLLHRAGEGCMKLSMELLGVSIPFGGHRYTITQVTDEQYDDMLTKALELEGEKLKFARRLDGHSTGKVYGYMNRAETFETVDDTLCNTTSLRVLAHNQEGESIRAAWITTGFGYLVTSRVLGTTRTKRYILEEEGTTTSGRDIQPEFGKKAGTPARLREVALHNINFDRDISLSKLIVTEINDMTQSHAAKSFAFMEWAYSQHPKQAQAFLVAGAVENSKRKKQIEEAFGMTLEEVETALKEWVLKTY